ncbi:phosphopantothenoylcysteine synthetase/decarboxylase [Lipingzhangella halophila]|uniref:Phosphopantothenoylcysteine synthetase/decarboxylase n=1 Tax=Lipingzhangella halophila TaxID=1783352 RepID=A0A7W7W5Z0_9ACTN|nr:flavoprotein [Lipingzhangella halophila]MBB4934320.1 phosphopantothenoylcysteine synthetase/decarboxylase [Lipingzhangella halophila]
MSETKTLYVVVCAAGPAADVGILIDQAHERGWTVQLIATPAALAFIDTDALEKQTGRPVRSEHRAPGSPRSPKADAIIIAPASFNTINKLANGIADTYALDVTNEAIGLGISLVILPFVNSAYANRAPFRASVEALRKEGVPVLIGPGAFEPHKAGSGADEHGQFPWHQPLDEVSPPELPNWAM